MALTITQKRIRASSKSGVDWNLLRDCAPEKGWDRSQIQIILLQEIRDQLVQLNALLNCPNFLSMPTTLRSINKKLAVKRSK